MPINKLTNGLAELELDCPQAVQKLMQFCELLLEKNKVMNLTGAKSEMEVVSRHFLDCAAAMHYLKPAGKKVFDLGTGAGFPGIPLCILYPETEAVLLDSLGKRVTFLGECIAALGLTNAQAIHARAEDYLPGHRESFDIVTSRAVANMRILAEISLPFVKVGGVFAAMKSTNCGDELLDAENCIEMLGGAIEEVYDYEVPADGVTQRLVIIRKMEKTKGKYPRPFRKISANPL